MQGEIFVDHFIGKNFYILREFIFAKWSKTKTSREFNTQIGWNETFAGTDFCKLSRMKHLHCFIFIVWSEKVECQRRIQNNEYKWTREI